MSTPLQASKIARSTGLGSPLEDGRQSDAARDIARGTVRLLALHGLRVIPEVALPNGRRADLVALGEKGDLVIVEVKSSVEDFRVDQKWPQYRDYCDRLFFAVSPTFPLTILPDDVGIIVADRWGGDMVREAAEHPMPIARRKSLTLRIARVAAGRLMTLADPEQAFEALPRM